MMVAISKEDFSKILKLVRDGLVKDCVKTVVVKINGYDLPGRIVVKGSAVTITFGPDSAPFAVYGLFSDDRTPSTSDVSINDGAEKVIRTVLDKGKPPTNFRLAAQKVLEEMGKTSAFNFFDDDVEEAPGKSAESFFDDFPSDNVAPGGGGGSVLSKEEKMKKFLAEIPKAAGFRGEITLEKLAGGTYQVLPNQAIKVLKVLNVNYREAMEIFFNANESAETENLKQCLKLAASEAVGNEHIWSDETLHDSVSAAQQGRRADYSYFSVVNKVMKEALALKGYGAEFTVIPAN